MGIKKIYQDGRTRVGTLAAVSMLILAACTSAVPTATPRAPAPAAVTGSGILGGDPEFNAGAMIWQGYWLSRDHFGPFVMASGMGIPFEPPMAMLQAAMGMVAQNPNDPITIPQNMLPLQAVYASGSPKLVNNPMDFGPMDFKGMRLDSATFDRKVTVRGQAETMLKESQWAHNFANGHFGDPKGNFGAQQRFLGMMVSLLAQMQGQYAMQNLLGQDGLYRDSNGALDYTGNWVMLHALSDIVGLTGEKDGRYMNPEAHQAFEGAATGLFRALEKRQTESPQEATAAIRALIYRVATTGDSNLRTAALAKARTIADSKLVGFRSNDVVASSAAIAGLIAVAAAQNDGKYRDAADVLFQALTADFDPVNGIFKSKKVYSADDIAWIIGGLNSLFQQGNAATKNSATRVLVAFYDSAINLSGIQLSAPPGKDGAMASDWEKNLPSAIYYHPTNSPPPPVAGKLTVPAEEITWEGTSWKVTSDRFVPAGAMHLANELNWLGPHLGSIPFPKP
jgi:hypothetical protein